MGYKELTSNAQFVAPDNDSPATAKAAECTGKVVYQRSKVTRKSVFLADRLARRFITVGGVAVIAAVMGIMVFLIAEVIPLFSGGEVIASNTYSLPSKASPVTTAWDEYRRIAVMPTADGEVSAIHAPSGSSLSSLGFEFSETPTALAKSISGGQVAYGFSDGKAVIADIQFSSEVLTLEAVPDGLQELGGGDRTDGAAIYSAIPGAQFRKVYHSLSQGEPFAVTGGAGVKTLSLAFSGEGQSSSKAIVALDDENSLWLTRVRTKKNMMTGELRTKTRTFPLPEIEGLSADPHLLVGKGGEEIIVAERSGALHRFLARGNKAPVLAEVSRLTEPGVGVTALSYLLGEQSLVVGGDDGSLNVFFLLRRENSRTEDGKRLVRTRDLPPHRAAIESITPSNIDKSLLTSDSNGALWLRNATSEKTLLDLTGNSKEFDSLAIAPRGNGVFAVDRNGSARYWDIHVPHPEASWNTFWGKIWYEGYEEPAYTWQSSAATDDHEPKLSLVPLVFGTLKATFYSMLFAVPLALLAAIFTSEFVDGRVRGVLKPAMEMMASLPSVVLGFVAALVLAPVVENWIGSTLLSFITVPLAILAGAYLWQLLPLNLAARLDGGFKFLCMAGFLILGVLVAIPLGKGFEHLFFAGSIVDWLSTDGLSGRPLTFLLFMPLSVFAVLAVGARYQINPLISLSKRADGLKAGVLSFGGFALALLIAGGLSAAATELLMQFGFDPRNGLVGTYVQRNTLMVGFAMGFAVIPIVFTIAEDALSAVPDHLRGASLGCGATPWQTTLWVVLPAAMSGIFSAIMVGMGRAVGETMIVVMAAGNTAILDVNIFNGLRALSANIAVELPEAVVGGTLYRTLFLSGLVLFAVTFVVNTVAELVRLRYRKKASQL